MLPAWPFLAAFAVLMVVLLFGILRDRGGVDVLSVVYRKWTSLGMVECIIVLFLVCQAVLYGGSKAESHRWSFTFQNGVSDSGSWCSNDVIHASWIYTPAFASYAFKWSYRNVTITNEVGVCIDPYHAMPDATVSDGVAEYQVAGATNMQVVCYAQYVAPVQVITNGVYHVSGVMKEMDATNGTEFVTPGIPILVSRGSGNTVRMFTLTPTNEPPSPRTVYMIRELSTED